MFQITFNAPVIKAAVEGAVKEALENTGDDLKDIVHQFVPVDTGDLRDSYQSEFPSPLTLRFGSAQDWAGAGGIGTKRGYETYYAPHVEFGEGHEFAQPHFVPAWEQAQKTFLVRFAEAAKKI